MLAIKNIPVFKITYLVSSMYLKKKVTDNSDWSPIIPFRDF